MDLIFTRTHQPTADEFDRWFWETLGTEWHDECPGDLTLMYIITYIITSPLSDHDFELKCKMLECVRKALPKYRAMWENNTLMDDELRQYKSDIYAIKNNLFLSRS